MKTTTYATKTMMTTRTTAKDRATSFATTTTTTTKTNDYKDNIIIGKNAGTTPASSTAQCWRWRQRNAGKDASATPAEMPALHQGTVMKPQVTTRKTAAMSSTPMYYD
jgi:hypothetical protein